MCNYEPRCVPVAHVLIDADLCLIMVIYSGPTGALLTDCREKASSRLHLKTRLVA